MFLKYPGPLASWPEARNALFSEGFQKLEEMDAKYPGWNEIPTVLERGDRFGAALPGH